MTTSNQKNIPALRFKEFDGEWEWFHGNRLFDKISDKKHKSDLPILAITQNQGAIPRDMINYKITVTHKSVATYKVVQVGDFIISLRSFQGGIEYSNYKGICSPAYIILRPKSSKVDRIFYKFYLKTSFYIKLLQQKLEGIRDGKMISYKYFSEIKLPLPSLPEQQKIARFLTAIDQKINQLSQKVQLQERYKKGVMQKLFSQELRFKDADGKDFADWEWLHGNKLFDKISDKKHKSDLPILAITQNQGAVPRDMINYKITVTHKSVATYKVVQVGDFIISLRSFQGGIEYSNYKGICSPAYIILRPKSSRVNRIFYKFYLKTSFYIKLLQQKLEGIRDGKMISYKYFSEIKLPLPSLPEQQKIAHFLNQLDEQIQQTGQQLAHLQDYKKGLLQQLFV